MPKAEGFQRMDVATDIHTDSKFRRLARQHPDLLPAAFMAYIATLGESWAEGARMSVEDAWPVLVPFQPEVVHALVDVHLLDADGLIATETWDVWFGEVARRREQNRERWREYARSRRGVHADSPGESPPGRRAESGASVPIRSVPINPPPPKRGPNKARMNGTNPRATGDNPRNADRRAAPQRLDEIVKRTDDIKAKNDREDMPEWS